MFLCLLFVFGLQNVFAAKRPFEVCSFNVSNLSVPGNLEELQEFCQKMKDYYSCYEERESEIQRPMQAGYPLLLLNSIFAVEQLCRNDSFLHKGYILHAECYKSLTKHWPYISKRQDIIASKITGLYKQVAPQDKFINAKDLENCIKGLQKLEMLETFIKNKCGKDATVIYQTILDKVEIHTWYCIEPDHEKTHNAIRKVMTAILSKQVPENEVVVDINERELFQSTMLQNQ